MLFRKCKCLVGLENRIFRKLISVDRKKMTLTMEIILHFHFHFKVFSKRERERERERERKRETETQLVPFARTSAGHEREKHQSAPFASTSAVDRDLAFAPIAIGAVLCEIAINASRDRVVDRDLAFAPIAIDASRDHAVDRDLAFAPIAISRSGAVLREIAIDGTVVGLELAKHRAIEPSRASIWVLSVFSGFVFSL